MSLAYLAVFIAVIGHASSEFVAVYSGIGGAEVSVWRFMIGSIGLVIGALCIPEARNLFEPLRHDGLRLLILSIFGVSIPYLIYHVALDYASVTQIATLVTISPIFMGLLNLALNHIPFTLPKIITGICALLGVTFLITDGYLERLAGSADSLTGILLVICSSVAISAYAVLAKTIDQSLRCYPYYNCQHSHWCRRIVATGRFFLAQLGQPVKFIRKNAA